MLGNWPNREVVSSPAAFPPLGDDEILRSGQVVQINGLPPYLERGEAMTKADLVEEISKVTGLNKKDTSIIVNEIIANICRALAEGDKVELRGFGSFKVKERRARRARNPRTGEGVFVPAKLVPYFKASNELKVRVNTTDQTIPM